MSTLHRIMCIILMNNWHKNLILTKCTSLENASCLSIKYFCVLIYACCCNAAFHHIIYWFMTCTYTSMIIFNSRIPEGQERSSVSPWIIVAVAFAVILAVVCCIVCYIIRRKSKINNYWNWSGIFFFRIPLILIYLHKLFLR